MILSKCKLKMEVKMTKMVFLFQKGCVCWDRSEDRDVSASLNYRRTFRNTSDSAKQISKTSASLFSFQIKLWRTTSIEKEFSGCDVIMCCNQLKIFLKWSGSGKFIKKLLFLEISKLFSVLLLNSNYSSAELGLSAYRNFDKDHKASMS